MACSNCKCDDCYLEFNPMYGPDAPQTCFDCGERTGTDSRMCSSCIQKARKRWNDHLWGPLATDVKMIGLDAYLQMMREAQE